MSLINYRTLFQNLAFILGLLAARAGLAQTFPEVWFTPAGESPDFTELFTSPDRWSNTRSALQVMGFIASEVRPGQPRDRALAAKLRKVDAFAKLAAWGIGASLEVPALKGWDCTGDRAAEATAAALVTARSFGAMIKYLSMDEPLVSVIPGDKPACPLSVQEAATRITEYARRILSDPRASASGPAPSFIDIEAYPDIGVPELKSWIAALQESEFPLAGVNLDVNLHLVDIRPELSARLNSDLREIKAFLASKHVPFGIIIWSGYDPLLYDKEYFDHTMRWVHIVHDAIGRPDRIIFQSWVKRCTPESRCEGPIADCGEVDASFCGRQSIPSNLPESGPGVYSHTALIREALAVFVVNQR